MIKYTICFIRRGNELLLLNRERSSWMGCWNGIGGKLENGETPRESMIRELYEETQLTTYRLQYKGMITWMVDGKNYGGMYTYLAEVPDQLEYNTPIKTDEGILDWKTIEWVTHPSNQGIAANIPESIDKILNDPNCYEHHCMYIEGKLHNHISTRMDPETERNEAIRDQHFRQYVREAAAGQSH